MRFLGVYFDGQAVKTALVDKRGRVLSCQTQPIGRTHPSLRLRCGPYVVSGLSGEDVLLRQVELPLKQRRKILAALPFALEGVLPASEAQVMVSPWRLEKTKRGCTVSLFVSWEDKVRSFVEMSTGKGVFPDVIACAPLALFVVCKHLYPGEKEMIACHFGEGETFWIYLKEGELAAAQHVPKHAAFMQEYPKICAFLQKKKGAAKDVPCALFGQIPEKRPAMRALPCAAVPYVEHAIPIGFALLGDAFPVQFAQKGAITPRLRAHRRKQSLARLSVAFVCIVLMGLVAWALLEKKRAPLVAATGNGGHVDVREALDRREKELRAKRDALHRMRSPKVAHVLAWLSAHPALATAQGAPRKGIEVTRVHTHLESFPTRKGPMRPYTMTVEIELESAEPKHAEHFHQALKQGDPFIDETKPIRWEAHAPSYKATFSIKTH